MQSKPTNSEFTRTKLPWIAAGVMFLIYLVTINQWVSTRSLAQVAKIAGYDWVLPAQWPLYFTLTYPLHWLPAQWQPIGLNFFSLICATLTIALLVRSVALLPHDRTDEQRIRQRSSDALLNTNWAWAPAALAAAVLGLELTMWEHATVGTSEALDLLVFAYLVRCVLEFRVGKEERWLFRLAFIYGLGVTNNWALIGFFPLFLTSLIWIRGKAFFNLQFAVKMAALGLCGMLLYLVLPLVWQFKSGGLGTFWELLRSELSQQKMMFANTPSLRARALILSLTSILPVVIMGVKFPAGFGEVSSAGASITNLMFRVIHLVFAGACIWVAFDQRVSPRSLGLGLPFLTFYYLGALAVGYYVGYLMVVHTDPPKKSYRQVSPFAKLANPVVQGAAWLAVAIVPIALVYKNFKIARAENGKLLMDFAETTSTQLPERPAIVLGDDQYQLWLMDAWYAHTGKNPHMLVNPRQLTAPAYHRNLVRRYGDRWPATAAKEDVKTRIDPNMVALSLAQLAITNSMYYLHPAFGTIFEVIYSEPRGLVHELKRYPTNVIFAPRLSASTIQSNQALWKKTETLVNRAEALTPFGIDDVRFVNGYLSRSLNNWAVEMQRAGNYKDAEPMFEQAISLNTNRVAVANLNFIKARSGKSKPTAAMEESPVEDLLGYRSWDSLLIDGGPIDIPEYLYLEGNAFRSQFQVRQAADCFLRAAELTPTNPTPRLALAATLITGKFTDEALNVIMGLRKDTNTTRANQLDLISMEAAIFFARQDTNRAETILKQAMQTYPGERTFYDSLNEMYRASGQWNKAADLSAKLIAQSPTNVAARLQRVEMSLNAGDTNTAAGDLKELEKLAPNNLDASLFRIFLALQDKDYKRATAEVDKVLQVNDRNPQALVYRGIIFMEQKEDAKAVEAFNAALKTDPGNVTALRNRAIANLRSENLNDARKDYETLLYSLPPSHAVYYGLAEIAYKKKQNQEALKNYELYLRFAPKEGPPELIEERKRVEGLVKELKPATK